MRIEALKRYGNHDWDCGLRLRCADCTCGFDAAIKAAQQPEPMLKDRIANGYTQEVSDMLWGKQPEPMSDEQIKKIWLNTGNSYMAFARALLSAQPDGWVSEWTPHGIKREGECVWIQDSDGAWNTSCQQTYEFTHDGPAENHANFCYHCGGALLPEPYSDAAAAPKEAR